MGKNLLKVGAAIASAMLTTSGCGLVRASQATNLDAGPQTAGILDLSVGLTTPGQTFGISPNPVAISPKVFIRADTNRPPNCTYGIFVSDPRYLVADGGIEPDNGLLLVASADMNLLNSDPSLNGSSRTGCPEPSLYHYNVDGGFGVGGALPDGVQPGDTLSVSGELVPYCETFVKALDACGTPVFPEFSPVSVVDLGPGAAPFAAAIDAGLVSDQAGGSVLQYAAMLLEVKGVQTVNPNGDTNGSIVVDPGQLWIESFDSTVSVPQTQGQIFTSITGVLHFQNGHWRLRPRVQSDIVP